jgi:hypothetical protein
MFAVLIVVAAAAQRSSMSAVHVRQLRPYRLDIGGSAVRGINGFSTPYIYDIVIDSNVVGANVPEALQPRLTRSTKGLYGEVEKVFMKPYYLRWMSHILRGAEKDLGLIDKRALRDLLPDRQSNSYALSSGCLSFARTGLAFGRDLVSKHATITPSFEEVHFAGQFWRNGDTLWFNGQSGTFVKKRKSTKLNKAPPHEVMILIMQSIFNPEFVVAFTDDVAPGFAQAEAREQADKATAAAKKAEAAASRVRGNAASAQLIVVAKQAREKAKEAMEASTKVPKRTSDKGWYILDRTAAKATTDVRDARKQIETLLEKEELE